ncbi:MAG: peptidoglycan-binding protein, partial [Rhodospirillales bacterium]|nr:peptidoglycan-binding protein [Rhodospirillales bacterium]
PTAAPIDAPQDVSQSTGTVLGDMIDASTPDRAFAQLFSIWGKSYAELHGQTPCDKAKTAGLACLQGDTDVAGLKAMNQPAAVSFVMPDGEHVFGVVTKISANAAAETVTLHFEDRVLPMSANAFAIRWPGDYLVLWQPPKTIARPLVFGQQGEDVRELRRLLAKAGFADGDNDLKGQGSIFYGPSLRDKVRAFQAAHGLDVDGIAGPETLLRITGIAGETTVPAIFMPEN